jgi:hypothetical protein
MNETKLDDLQVAAYVMACGYPLLRTEGDRRRTVFVFKDVPEAAIFAYFQERDCIPARRLFSALRDLKSLVFQAQ